MPGGYTGKYCIVNLSNGQTEVVAPAGDFYRTFLSGYGLGAAVILERQEAGIDPLSPESHLGLCSGLLTGTGAFFSGRFAVVGKSPLTGGWGDANSGGFFSRELKRAGYDALFFTGRANKPVWVYLSDQGIEIRDAINLWGRDTVETEKIIKDELDNKKVQIASIGMSGEKLSLISGVVTDAGRIAGRSGLGAVMGSKNLKAIAVRGSQKVPVARPDEVKKINKGFLENFKKSKRSDRVTVRFMNYLSQLIARTGVSIPAQASTLKEIYKRYGTSGLTVYSAMIGDMPIKNWQGAGIVDYPIEMASKGSDERVISYQKHRYACQACPLGCGGIIDIKTGRYKGTTGHKPEYETLGAFGGLILNDDLDAIIEMNEMCNRAGIDTISTGATVAFAIECFENGIIDEKTTDGLALGWGKAQETIKLTEMIIQREGFGDTLADGVKRAAEKIGKGSEAFALHAGGQELPMHDSRLDPGYAIAYECEPTPGRHTISCYLYPGLFGVKKKFPEVRRMIKRAKGKDAKKVRLYAAGSIYMQLVNATGLCMFGAMTSPLPVVEYLNAVTGWDLSADEYFKVGERILSLRKAFNRREGITGEDQRIHKRALGKPPLEKGPLKGTTIDTAPLKREFFDAVGWDPAGIGPTEEKMKELEIEALF